MSDPDLKILPRLRLEGDEPVFKEPWQAQAFAMAIAMHEKGVFGWDEWASALSDQLSRAENDHVENYYHHWLAALEALMTQKGITTSTALADREQAWHDAAARTPHGQPIELD